MVERWTRGLQARFGRPLSQHCRLGKKGQRAGTRRAAEDFLGREMGQACRNLEFFSHQVNY